MNRYPDTDKIEGSNGQDFSDTSLKEEFPAGYEPLFAEIIPVTLTPQMLGLLLRFIYTYIGLSKGDRYDVAIDKGLTLFGALCICRKLSPFQLHRESITLKLSPLEIIALDDLVECLEVYGYFRSGVREIVDGVHFVESLVGNSIGGSDGEWTPAHKLAFAFADLYRARHKDAFDTKTVSCDCETGGMCYGSANPDEVLLWCMQKRLDIIKYIDPWLWDFWIDPEDGDDIESCPFMKSMPGPDGPVCRLGGCAP